MQLSISQPCLPALGKEVASQCNAHLQANDVGASHDAAAIHVQAAWVDHGAVCGSCTTKLSTP